MDFNGWALIGFREDRGAAGRPGRGGLLFVAPTPQKKHLPLLLRLASCENIQTERGRDSTTSTGFDSMMTGGGSTALAYHCASVSS